MSTDFDQIRWRFIHTRPYRRVFKLNEFEARNIKIDI